MLPSDWRQSTGRFSGPIITGLALPRLLRQIRPDSAYERYEQRGEPRSDDRPARPSDACSDERTSCGSSRLLLSVQALVILAVASSIISLGARLSTRAPGGFQDRVLGVPA